MLYCGAFGMRDLQRVIEAKITGPHQWSDLPQGGLEVPCTLILEHQDDKKAEDENNYICRS